MAGRKRQIDTDILFKILEAEKNVIQVGSRIPGPTNECWKNIAKLYGQGITPKHIYTILLLNRYGIADKLGLNPMIIEEKVPNEDEVHWQDEAIDNDYDTGSSEAETNTLRFKITLSSQEWEKLYLECEYFRGDRNVNRRYEVLKPSEWTRIMNEHFYALSKCACCVVYKRCTLTPDGASFLRFEGKCTSCNSQLRGEIYQPPRANSRVIVDCTYRGDYQKCKTSRKRRVIGEKKVDYLSKMLQENKSASFIQKEEASKLMKYGDTEPAHLPTLNAFRVMKYKTKMETRLDKDPIIAILQLKSSVPYSEMIREVGYDHFYIHYWTTFQINNYRVYATKTLAPCISIDATGSLVTPINLLTGRKTNSIFLYEIAVLDNLKKVQFSVGEMLSEAHDNHSISYWLSKWATNRLPLPKIVVTDMSRALMMACVKSFTQYSTLTKYLEVCWSLLCGERNEDPPTCMLRNDFAHIMHLMSGWPELKNAESPRIRKFYLRTFALVISSTDWEDTKLLLKYIFTISLTETEGSDDYGEETPCELAIEFLKQRIAGMSPEIDTEKLSEMEDDPDDICIEEDCEDTFQQENVRQIYDRCRRTANDITGNRDNPFYKPKLADRLLKLAELLPLWSAIMVPIFQFGNITQSSTASESLFKELKKDAFQHENLPMRVDDFLEKHLNFLEGATILTGSKYAEEDEEICLEKQNEKPENITTSNAVKDQEQKCPGKPCEKGEETGTHNTASKHKDLLDYLKIAPIEEAQENWRGLNSQSVKSNYLGIDKTVLNQKFTKTKCPVIGLISNGNAAKLNSVKIGNYFYSFTNTCPFDAITQLVFVAYADSEIYKSFIQTNEKDLIFFQLVKHGVTDGITAQLYRRRAIIYTQIYEKLIQSQISKGVTNNSINIDTNTTVRWLLTELLLSKPSISECRICIVCAERRQRKQVALLINLMTDDLNFFTDAVVNELTEAVKCDFCGAQIPREKTYCQIDLAPHMFIEVAPSLEYMKEVNDDLQITLSAVPTTLTLLEKPYFLRGLISFQAPKRKTINSIGHYIAYGYRSNGIWEKYDDLSRCVRNVRPSTTVQVQFILYSL